MKYFDEWYSYDIIYFFVITLPKHFHVTEITPCSLFLHFVPYAGILDCTGSVSRIFTANISSNAIKCQLNYTFFLYRCQVCYMIIAGRNRCRGVSVIAVIDGVTFFVMSDLLYCMRRLINQYGKAEGAFRAVKIKPR